MILDVGTGSGRFLVDFLSHEYVRTRLRYFKGPAQNFGIL